MTPLPSTRVGRVLGAPFAKLLSEHGVTFGRWEKGDTLIPERDRVEFNNPHTRGYFCWGDRVVIVKDDSLAALVHESGHALDFVLGFFSGNGTYYSNVDPRIATALRRAQRRGLAVTSYALRDTREYFAEGLRAYLGANDMAWPAHPVSRHRLYVVDRFLHDYINTLWMLVVKQA